jgi:hypothetical protein
LSFMGGHLQVSRTLPSAVSMTEPRREAIQLTIRRG